MLGILLDRALGVGENFWEHGSVLRRQLRLADLKLLISINFYIFYVREIDQDPLTST